ncbi:MAG TPA: hypothetical protein VI953_01390 [Candidatus Paceibacterota bacterium]
MINLLPESAKDKIRKVYVLRVVATALFALLVLLVSCDIFLLPSFLILSSKGDATTLALSTARLRPVSKEADTAVAEIEEVNTKIRLITAIGRPFSTGGMLDRILSHKTSNITLSNIDYSSDSKVNLKGVARDREALLTLVKNLQDDPMFAEVGSPISNLIENHDIAFNINMKVQEIAP